MRRGLGFLLTAALGAAVVVLPAVAASETGQTIEATNKPGGGIYKEETHEWSPSTVTVSVGGVVPFSNPTAVNHGVEWRVGDPATPSCAGGVPVGTTEAASATNWSGTCTFTTPGTYVFYCTVHHAAMTGAIVVAANGTTTTTTTTPAPSPLTTPTTSGEPSSGSTLGSPLSASASAALKVASKQHGKSVHGSLDVSRAGAGGRLEVDLLARSASLASVGHQVQVRVGKLVRTALSAGKASFSVPLNARAKAALLRRGHLALTVKVLVKPASGSAVTVTRAVVLHS
jgi:plastocyanin